ncbi:hypothetical protein HK104_004090 [Borealophlyctis nickersoniae]|nr:hypothetical protein HK104_004090 [Borealophlyctis nickersoniae]
MSKPFSLSSIFSKKGNIFVQGPSRESAITKLHDTALTTAELLDEVGHVYQIKLKAEDEINELRTILTERLSRDEFGLRNVTLKSNKLQRFIANAQVFDWFAKAHSEVAGRIQAGLRERLASPMSKAERLRELEERVKEQNRQLAVLLDNQPNEPIGFAYPCLPQKRVWVAGPGEFSGREESDGRDDNGRDALDEPIYWPETEFCREDTGGEASVATDTVEVVPKGGKTREEEFERKLAAREKEFERKLAARKKEIKREFERELAAREEKEIERKLAARMKQYEADMEKWMKNMEEAKDVEEKTFYEGKLETTKKNWEAYQKRKMEELQTVRAFMKGKDDTGGPSTRENVPFRTSPLSLYFNL